MMARPPLRPTAATWLALTWTALLVVLASLWVRSPFLGEGIAFIVWSVPAAVLAAWSLRWLRARRISQVPTQPAIWLTLAIAWLLALLAASTEVGRRLALDGLIMRQPGVRLTGHVLRWTPLAFGCSVAIAGLAAALEARYRILNDPGTRATPRDSAR